MKNKKIVVLAAAVLGITSNAFGQVVEEHYDDFNAKDFNGCKKCINTDLWGSSYRNGYNVGDHTKAISGKKLQMNVRGWGDTDDDEGEDNSRIRSVFLDTSNMKGACFIPSVKKHEIGDCAANPSHGSVRFRYIGAMYDSNTADDNFEGIIYAWMNFQRHGDSTEKKGVVSVFGTAEMCDDADCTSYDNWNTYDGVNDPDLWFGEFKLNNNKNLRACLFLDTATDELVFSFGEEGNEIERRVTTTDHDLPDTFNNVHPNQEWHTFEARVDVEECNSGPRVNNYVETLVDDVYRVVDDF